MKKLNLEIYSQFTKSIEEKYQVQHLNKWRGNDTPNQSSTSIPKDTKPVHKIRLQRSTSLLKVAKSANTSKVIYNDDSKPKRECTPDSDANIVEDLQSVISQFQSNKNIQLLNASDLKKSIAQIEKKYQKIKQKRKKLLTRNEELYYGMNTHQLAIINLKQVISKFSSPRSNVPKKMESQSIKENGSLLAKTTSFFASDSPTKISIINKKIVMENEYLRECKEELKENLQMYDHNNSLLEKIKAFLKKGQITLYNFYHLQLSSENYVKQEGATSVIKQIWEMGEVVDVSKLPPWLDNESMQFIFNKARLEKEFDELKIDIKKSSNAPKFTQKPYQLQDNNRSRSV